MIQPSSSPPVANQSSIAIGIAGSAVTRDKNQKHVSLIYRNSEGHPWLLHLGWHMDLKHEPWNGAYHWIEFTGLNVEVEEAFADWAVLVAGAAQSTPIPYSVVLSPDRNFAVDGHYIDRRDGSGLTCATFILALFSDYGLPLLDRTSWPSSRPGDAEWALKILEMLRKYVELPHYLEQLRQVYVLKRFRPEEVLVTGTLYKGEPLKFDVVNPVAQKCLVQAPK